MVAPALPERAEVVIVGGGVVGAGGAGEGHIVCCTIFPVPLPAEVAEETGDLEMEVAVVRCPAARHDDWLHDPRWERIRA